MKVAIISRTLYATMIIEYLNTYMNDIKYEYTYPDYFGSNEVTVFIVDGNEEDLSTIYNYIHRSTFFSSNDVLAVTTDTKLKEAP